MKTLPMKYKAVEKARRFFCLFLAPALVSGFLLFTAADISAQEEGARIYRIEGTDIAITRGGGRAVFQAEAAAGEGIFLERSSIVHTGAGTFLELQLPSGALIKLSENTSLVYNGIDETGKFADLGLLYGRIRVVTGDTASDAAQNPVVIRGGGVSARLLEGDLGVDYILKPDSRDSAPRPIFTVYAFRGSAELFPYGKGGNAAYFGGVNAIAAEEGKSLSVDISSSYTFAENTLLGGEIIAYWTARNFAGQAPLPMPDTSLAPAAATPAAAAPVAASAPGESETPAAAAEPAAALQLPGETPKVINNRRKNIILGVGLFLAASGLVMQGVSRNHFNTSNDSLARNMYNIGYAPIGIGLLTILSGILYDPLFVER